MSEWWSGVLTTVIFAVGGMLVYSLLNPKHRHQWLPWARQVWNDKPMAFSGAFGYRELEVSVCATCGEVKARMIAGKENG